jgi:hypothetical protein
MKIRMIACILSVLSAAMSLAHAQGPYLIIAQHSTDSRTQFIVPRIQYLESLPFDGMSINTPESWSAMSPGYAVDSASFWNGWLKQLNGIFTRFTQNYFMIFVDKPADFFDDWTQTIENWRLIAQGAHRIGAVGIAFDNEEYAGKLWTYPDDVAYTTRTLVEYRTQAALRGKQIMQAVCSVFPNVKMKVYHGPYVSEPKTPSYVTRNQVGVSAANLRGPFFAGMLEGCGPQATLIDGGEVYQYRTVQDFERSYQWRRYGIAADSTNCAFIGPSLRPVWRQKLNISFGIYNRAWPDAVKDSMNPAIMRTTAERALRRCDEMVWFFIEGGDAWLQPNGMPQVWQDSIRAAVTAARASSAAIRRPESPPAPSSRAQPFLRLVAENGAGVRVAIYRPDGTTGFFLISGKPVTARY